MRSDIGKKGPESGNNEYYRLLAFNFLTSHKSLGLLGCVPVILERAGSLAIHNSSHMQASWFQCFGVGQMSARES